MKVTFAIGAMLAAALAAIAGPEKPPKTTAKRRLLHVFFLKFIALFPFEH